MVSLLSIMNIWKSLRGQYCYFKISSFYTASLSFYIFSQQRLDKGFKECERYFKSSLNFNGYFEDLIQRNNSLELYNLKSRLKVFQIVKCIEKMWKVNVLGILKSDEKKPQRNTNFSIVCWYIIVFQWNYGN